MGKRKKQILTETELEQIHLRQRKKYIRDEQFYIRKREYSRLRYRKLKEEGKHKSIRDLSPKEQEKLRELWRMRNIERAKKKEQNEALLLKNSSAESKEKRPKKKIENKSLLLKDSSTSTRGDGCNSPQNDVILISPIVLSSEEETIHKHNYAQKRNTHARDQDHSKSLFAGVHHDKMHHANCADTCVRPRTSKIPKITIEPLFNEEPTKPNVTFQINVEVEECDEEDFEIKDNMDMNEAMEQVLSIPLPEYDDGNLTAEKIIKHSNKIVKASGNEADKILDVGLKNVLGVELMTPIELLPIEESIQKVLDSWRTYKSKRPYTNRPLFYKCYICSFSWWHFGPFETHCISKHQDTSLLRFKLELYTPYEVNVIAYTGKMPKIRDIDVLDGFCGLCGKTYMFHKLSSRQSKMYYTQLNGCKKNLTTCTDWSNHVRFCVSCRKDANLSCDICYSVFDSKYLLKQHQIACHAVRSDELIDSPYKICEKCHTRYISEAHHPCIKLSKWDCSYCFRSFFSQNMCQEHMDKSLFQYHCDVCDSSVMWNCQKYEHLIIHSDNYRIVKKCRVCKEFEVFCNDEDVKKHKVMHGSSNVEFSKIIIPKSCVAHISNTEFLQPKIERVESQIKSEIPSDNELPPEYEPALDEPAPEYESESENQNISIKEEPEEIIEQETLIIKEEVEDNEEQSEIDDQDQLDNESQSYSEDDTVNFDPEIEIKEEFEIEEMDGDIIKLNFDITDHLETIVKEEEENFELATNDSDCTTKKPRKKYTRVTFNCRKCGFYGTNEQLKAHLKIPCKSQPSLFRKKKIYCSKCTTKFDSMKLYLKHLVNHGYELLTCPVCPKQFERFSMLAYHIFSHVKQNFIRVKYISMEPKNEERRCMVHQCKKCSDNVNVDRFFEHWEMHLPNHASDVSEDVKGSEHTVTPKISGSRPCEIFQEEKIQESLRLIQQYNKKINCNHCSRKFRRIYETKRHIIEHLLAHAYSQKPVFKELRCQICGTGFHKSEKYKQHLRDHASLPVYKCELCDRTFSDSSNFTKHKKVHNWRCLICDVCGAKFQAKSTLEKHLMLHMKTNPIKCETCYKVFHFESTYRKHIRKFHEKRSSRFRCQTCQTDFPSLKLKWTHMWEAHQERKAMADCPLCFKSYRRYIDVRMHLKNDHNVDMSRFKLGSRYRSQEECF